MTSLRCLGEDRRRLLYLLISSDFHGEGCNWTGTKVVQKSSLSIQAQSDVCFINDCSDGGDDGDDDLLTDNIAA